MSRSNPFCESLEPRKLLAAVTYDFSTTAQTIDSIGGNYSKAPFHPTANDAIGAYTLDNLKPGVVRVPILLSQWEAVNDNADPSTQNSDAFAAADVGKVHDVFLMMQEYESRGLTISAAIFNAPNWMVSNPSASSKRLVAEENWPELVESIKSFLEYAKANYGVTIDNLSINEANGGYSLLFAAQDMANFIELAGPQLTGTGIGDPKWLVGDTYQVKNTAAYARTILNDVGAKPYLGPIAFHTWWSESIASSVWQEIANLGKEFNKPIWASEVGYDAQAWTTTPWIFPTWQNAERLAVTYHKALALAGSNTALYWQYQDDFPFMSADTSDRYYAYHVVKQLAENLPKGSQLTSAVSDTSTILSLAAKHATNGTFMSQLINTSSSDKTMTLKGLPNTPVTLLRTSMAGEKSKTIGTYTPVNGQLTLTLKGDSVNILKGALVAPPPPTGQQPFHGLPFAVGSSPLMIQAEDYDKGGQGVSYNDTTSTNLGGKYRTSEAVDIKTIANTTNQYRISDATSGEWLEYMLDIATEGQYLLEFRVGNRDPGSTFRAEIEGFGNVTGTLNVPDTNSFDAFATVSKTATLPAGRKILRFNFDSPGSSGYGAALDWIRISPATTQPPPTGPFTFITNTATYVRGGTYASQNFGNANDLIVKNSPNGATNSRETYLKFDLTSLSSDTTITSAKLRLYGKLSDTQDASIGFHAFEGSNTDWTETSLTWNNKPIAIPTILASSTVSGTTSTWYELDLTSFLQYEIGTGSQAITLVLQASGYSGSQISFASDETANGPRLIVS